MSGCRWKIGVTAAVFVFLLAVLSACSVAGNVPSTPVSTTERATPEATFTPTPTPTVPPTPTAVPTRVPSLPEAMRAAHNGECKKAVDLFERVIPALPEKDRSEALYRLGGCCASLGDWRCALDAWNGIPEGSSRFDDALFLKGRAYAELHQPSNAEVSFRSYLTHTHQITDVVLSMIAESYVDRNEVHRAVKTWRSAAKAAPTRKEKAFILADAASRLEGLGDYEDAVEFYQAVVANSRVKKYRARMWRKIGDLWEKLGSIDKAKEAWLNSFEEDATSRDAYLSLVKLVKNDVKVDEYRRGVVDYNAGAYGPAIRAFRRFLAQAPSENRESATLYLAQSLGIMRQEREALATLQPLLKLDPASSEWGFKARLLQAKLYQYAGKWEKAHSLLLKLASLDLPQDRGGEALWRAAQMALYHERYDLAAGDIVALLSKYPKAELAPKALLALGLGAYRFGMYESSRQAFETLRKEFRNFSPDEVSFWIGYSALKAGDKEGAESAWKEISGKEGYYPLKAREIGKKAGLSLPQPPPVMATCEKTTVAPKLPEMGESWSRGEALLRVGMWEDGVEALREAASSYLDSPEDCFAIAVEAGKLGAYDLSVRYATRALRRWSGKPPCRLYYLAYPTYYSDLLAREAHSKGIDPYFVLAMVRQESCFAPYSGSVAGAQGLMQLIPSTAEWVAKKLGEPDPRGRLHLPETNVHLGMYYLLQALRSFDGNETLALAAYNAGPKAVSGWVKVYGNDEPLLSEVVPYKETRSYIRAIPFQEDLYRRLYPDGLPPLDPVTRDEGLMIVYR